MELLIVGFFAWIALMLLCRELVCWYWKQNEIVYILRGIEAQLKRLNEK